MGAGGGGGGSDPLKYAEKAAALYDDIKPFEIDETPYEYMGDWTPDSYQVFKSDAPQQGIEWGPEGKAAMLRSLGKLQQIGDEGFTLEDRIAADEVLRGADKTRARGVAAITRDAEARGQADSGLTRLAKLQAVQDAAESGRDQGNELLQQAMLRKLQGIAASGTLGGQMRQQDMAQGATQYNALNTFNTNVMNSINRQREHQANLDADASQWNIDRKEDSQNRNADLKRAIQQQEFTNKMDIVRGKASALTGTANVAAQQQQLSQQRAAARSQRNAQIGSAVGMGAGAAIGSVIPGVGTMVGGMIGGALGGGAGGMF
jgi:hypothetical protein